MSTLTEKLRDVEKKELVYALRMCNGNILKAAKRLGITERMIRYKINKHGLKISKEVFDTLSQ